MEFLSMFNLREFFYHNISTVIALKKPSAKTFDFL